MTNDDRQLIFNQIDNAIALFNPSHYLILFNQKFTQLWGLPMEWLGQEPHFKEVWARVVEQGYWSTTQSDELELALPTETSQQVSFRLEQADGIHLTVKITVTADGGHLFTFHDITAKAEASLMQMSLNAEIKRLRFLQGLTERMQSAEEMREIGQFALTYLVQTTGAAFGDVKVITGEGKDARAGVLMNNVSTQFIATYGTVVVENMEAILNQGIPYGQGLLWQVVETGKPLFVKDYKNHPQSLPAFRHGGIGELGLFPISSSTGKIIGVLTLECRCEQKLQEALQQDMLLAACRTLGVAIERAQSQEHLRQVNEHLERASQLKSEFLASMSHELRTPLNSILGFSDLLERQTGGSLTPRQISHVKAIASSGKHLLSLINDILDLSKIEAGKVDLELTPVSIPALCNHCLKMIQPRADKKRLCLSLELDYRLQEAFLDERRVRQILINLLSNAVKFTPETGIVKLSGRLAYGSELKKEWRPDCSPVNCSTPYLCLEVRDSGIGIPKDKFHFLFQPFQQIDASLKRRHEGTGLGLALTKRLAELHGGTVSVESRENEGSVFRVWLPITEMRSTLAANTRAINPETSRESFLRQKRLVGNAKRILVVEDQLLNQALISEILEMEGYLVEVISDGQTMLNIIQDRSVKPLSLPHLILMDIQLPDVDGFELIRQLKATSGWQNIPTIALTAMAMAGDRDRCLQAGADDYLSKPLDLEKAIATVRSLIDKL
ncbi:hybrid sensor histidine kinase/response regulator [Limnofasciculus baicalensis]|uniref:Circadian input-output histidine kinase CikA n=1 Tax=Limnofasciculus baicalensis BBK-W-15 TaxID=2699891 RepID=A0AAE3GW67_9CYAN|nr:ATP-binding protein [Limnofasciculus baicalensis]MCP2731614.1 ATP-binding protein [Limnofasciculus baicalensis BBK-W-15]